VWAVSAAFLEAIRGPHTAYGFVEAWRAGARLSYTTSAGETATRLPLLDGGVSVDGGTPGTRRNLSVSLAREPGLWDVLAPVGVELRAYTALEYLTGATEVVPQGVFPVDVQRVGYGPDGTLQLTAPDRWATIQAALFPTPRKIGGGGADRPRRHHHPPHRGTAAGHRRRRLLHLHGDGAGADPRRGPRQDHRGHRHRRRPRRVFRP
jgi:hypothetical protein